MIVEGVEVEVELVGLDLFIASGECRLDPLRLAVVQACAHIECVIPDEHSHLGPLRGGLPLSGFGLPEVSGRFGAGPRALIEAAVHRDAALDSGCPDLWGVRMPVARDRIGEGGCLALESADKGERKRYWKDARHRTPESTSERPRTLTCHRSQRLQWGCT